MTKRLTPAAIVALKEALSKVYWYKSDQRSFLTSVIRDANILGGIDWSAYKRQIASDVVDQLCADPERYGGLLTHLCAAVCDLTQFKHLESLEGGAEKAKRAKEAVQSLRLLFETHTGATSEQDATKARMERERERLARSGAVREKLHDIRTRYMTLVTASDSQARGYELEKLLYDVFELFDLDPKASFRITGEQIDGAFSLEGTDYLFEAKWQRSPCNASDIDAFAGKVQRKLDNTLGVFLSINGFSADAISTVQRGRAIVLLMDGSHLMGVLEERIDLASLLLRLKRHAAHTGNIYLPLQDILGGTT